MAASADRYVQSLGVAVNVNVRPLAGMVDPDFLVTLGIRLSDRRGQDGLQHLFRMKQRVPAPEFVILRRCEQRQKKKYQ